MNKLCFKPYTSEYRQVFVAMLDDYFNNDLKEKISFDRIKLIAARIEYELGIYDMGLYMLYSVVSSIAKPVPQGLPGPLPVHTEELAGFIWFQTDTSENPWCLKPGWGFIREIYILPSLRRLGFGEAAAREAVRLLRKSGANNIYLTAESQNSQAFWLKLGFCESGEICTRNGLNILISKNSVKILKNL